MFSHENESWRSILGVFRTGLHLDSVSTLHCLGLSTILWYLSLGGLDGNTDQNTGQRNISLDVSEIYQRFSNSPWIGHTCFIHNPSKSCPATSQKTQTRSGDHQHQIHLLGTMNMYRYSFMAIHQIVEIFQSGWKCWTSWSTMSLLYAKASIQTLIPESLTIEEHYGITTIRPTFWNTMC